MAETDWGIIGSDAQYVRRGVTAGFTPPNGGSSFVFGFRSTVAEDNSVGLYYNPTAGKYNPLVDEDSNATGGSVRGALQRYTSANALGFSVFLFMNLQGTTTSEYGYLLGLSNNDPHEIMLAKTTIAAGLDPTDTATVLRTSSQTYAVGNWLHLRLDAIVNPNGDTVLKCFQNDLTTNLVSNPTWAAIAGMDDYIDDSLGINSSANPLAGGYAGFGFESSIVSAHALVDHVEVYRQM